MPHLGHHSLLTLESQLLPPPPHPPDAAGQDAVLHDQTFLAHWLCVLKIVHRKAPNRRVFGPKGVAALTKVLNLKAGHDVAREACNVTLNMCYDPANVTAFLDGGDGLPALVRHLSSRDHEVQASAAGALQSVCFQARGRIALRELGAISLVLTILSRARTEDRIRVMARATG